MSPGGALVSAIECRGASKAFRLYTERNQTIKQALLRRRRGSYAVRWAVRDLDLDIAVGETFGIIGGNGAGKSTTLKLLAGILVPDTGTVVTRGRVSALLELGAGFHPELSGRENVFLNGAILGLSRRALIDRYDEIVAFSGLGRHMEDPIKTYSSGMYARLGFAVAVNVDPDILLIDEVLAVGDEQFQRACAEKITELRSAGRTVVVVSHALGQLRTMCDRVAWFAEGRLAGIGPSSKTIDDYLESVHPTATIDERGRTRLGEGATRTDGCLVGEARTGAPLSFAFHFHGETPSPRSLLWMSVVRADGILVSTGATSVPPAIEADRCISLDVPALPLLPGRYDIAVRLTDETGGHVIDRCDHLFSFDVAPEHSDAIADGLIELFGTWRIGGREELR